MTEAAPDRPEGESWYRTLFQAIDQGCCLIEVILDDEGKAADYVFLEVNPAFEAQTGLIDASGRRMRELRPAHEEFWFETYGRIARTGAAERFEHKAEALDRWYEVYAFRVGLPEQRRVAILFNDIADRKHIEAALRTNEERLREFGEASSDVLWTRDAETLRWQYLSAAFERIYGMSREEALAGDSLRNWVELILPEDRARALEGIRAVREGERSTFEYRIRRPSDGQVRWLSDTDFPIRDEAGEVVRIAGIGHDITELKQADRHREALLAELQHRVRNTLGVVRSIARRTAMNSDSVEDMASHFEGRLDAFARVQSMVTRKPDGGIDLTTMIEDELLAHAAREGEQLNIEGPDIALQPKSAETVSLAIHELTTNAVKYGALSSEHGRVRIAWTVVDRRLDLVWEESGLLRPLAQPDREGFGAELLQRVVPYELGASTMLDFRSEGLRFTLSMPIDGNIRVA